MDDTISKQVLAAVQPAAIEARCSRVRSRYTARMMGLLRWSATWGQFAMPPASAEAI